MNGFTAVEVRDGNANVVRLASDNVLVGKVSDSAGIERGQIVYLAGATGANPLFGLARADSLATMPTVGMALDPGATNAFIRVLLSGTLQLLDTSAFPEGASLFVSPTTAGAMTTTLPVAPAFAQRVGFVTRTSATQGEVLVVTTPVDGPPRHHSVTHTNVGADPLTVTTLAGFPGGTTQFLRADGTFAAIGVTTASANAIPVLVDSNGQLGTISSSRRFKFDIWDMGGASNGLMRLRPVTFRYKQATADGTHPIEYGLIAEEVAEVNRDLVVYEKDGQALTVKYHLLPTMLLNEVQRQQRTIDELTRRLEELERRLTTQQR